MKITGLARADVQHREDALAAASATAIRRTLRSVTNQFSRVVTMDDLGTVLQVWTGHVDDVLQPALIVFYQSSAKYIQDQQEAQSAAVTMASVDSAAAEILLQNSRNHLIGIGNHVWEHSRNILANGLLAHDEAASLRSQVMSSAGLSLPRSNVVVHTEVNAVMNAGAITQMRQLESAIVNKTWRIVSDSRTRESHREADGQTVPLGQKFTIGGDLVDYPSDYDCRCVLDFEVPE